MVKKSSPDLLRRLARKWSGELEDWEKKENESTERECKVEGCLCKLGNVVWWSKDNPHPRIDEAQQNINEWEQTVQCIDPKCASSKVLVSNRRAATIIDLFHEYGVLYSHSEISNLTGWSLYWIRDTIQWLIRAEIVEYDRLAKEYRIIGCRLNIVVRRELDAKVEKLQKDYIGRWPIDSNVGMVYSVIVSKTKGATAQQIQERTGLSERQVRRAIQNLMDSGAVERYKPRKTYRKVEW